MQKVKNMTFYESLKKILRTYPMLVWLSESESNLTPVRFLFVKKYLWNWDEETNRESYKRLEAFKAANEHSEGAVKLVNLFMAQDNIVTFKRPNGNAAESELFVLVNFGYWYVGFKTRLIET